MSNNSKSDGKLVIETKDSGEIYETKISPIVLQSIYHDITKKTEQFVRDYHEHFIFKADEICNLVLKLRQYAESHNAVSINESISIFHHEGSTVTLSSLERFKMYDTSTGEPVRSVSISVKFLTNNVGTEPVSNEISIILRSYNFSLASEYFREEGLDNYSSPASLKISFVDYLLATAIEAIFASWLRGLNKSNFVRGGKKLPDTHVYKVTDMLALFGGLGVFFLVFKSVTVSDGSMLGVVLGFMAFYLVYTSLGHLFAAAGNQLFIGKWFPLIYLNQTDEKRNLELISKKTRALRWAKAFFFIGVLGVLISVIGSAVYGFITKA